MLKFGGLQVLKFQIGQASILSAGRRVFADDEGLLGRGLMACGAPDDGAVCHGPTLAFEAFANLTHVGVKTVKIVTTLGKDLLTCGLYFGDYGVIIHITRVLLGFQSPEVSILLRCRPLRCDAAYACC